MTNFPDQFVVVRADKIDQPGMIDAQIIGHLLDDDLVIADMTELNPNAFYEMGIRHMKELPIIHMFKKGEIIPFDVKLYRAIPFDYGDPTDLKAARADLTRALVAVLDPDYKPDNPVIRARGVVKLAESATPESTIIQQQLNEVSRRLASVEDRQLLSISESSHVIDEFEMQKFLQRFPPTATTIVVRFSPSTQDDQLNNMISSLEGALKTVITKFAGYRFGKAFLIKLQSEPSAPELLVITNLLRSIAGVSAVNVQQWERS
ncbi:hypothetical protein [Mesorhizobium sp. B2-3-12]|uniref:hypothetical protein n=1 Tax=Mesorhizobium sp. B2-3-12 TaxID=2589952 RepID=UPI0011278679|nr:hypothetical protein [Mesorhizobium sp. B2-3-12]TPL90100.1 hypothetical protein FJ948_17785 [Mesorhizobium sp. B2-3-12]